MTTVQSNYYITYTSLLTSFDLSKAAYKLACLLIKSHNKISQYSFKSKNTMAKECGYSVSTISRALRELKQKQLLTVKEDFDTAGSGKQKTNKYYIDLDLIKSQDTVGVKVSSNSIKLNPTHLKIYMFIAKKIGNRTCWQLSKNEIARACNVSRTTVHYAVKAMLKEHLIKLESEQKGRCYVKNKVSLVFEVQQQPQGKRKESSKMEFKAVYSKLTPSGKKVFDYFIKQENRGFKGAPSDLAHVCKLPSDAAQKAVRELCHYEVLSVWTVREDETNSTYAYQLDREKAEDSRIERLPQDVNNAQPYIVEMGNQLISSKALSADAYKVACFLWLFHAHYNAFPTIKEIQQYCGWSRKKCTEILDSLYKADMLIRQGDTYTLKDKQTEGIAFSDFSVFRLKGNLFRIYSLLYLLAEDKEKVFICQRSIAEHCGLCISSVGVNLRKLKEQSLISIQPFTLQDGTLMGNIYKLLRKNDTGVGNLMTP